MTVPITLYLTALPRQDRVVGQGVRCQAQPQGEAGATVAITGVVFTVTWPDGRTQPFSGESLGLSPLGPYLDLVLDQAGAWRVRAECTGPFAAALEINFVVRGSDVARPVRPGPVWMTRDLWTLYTQQGLPIDAVRVPALPRRTAIDGSELVPVVGTDDVTYGTSLASIAQVTAPIAAAASSAAEASRQGAQEAQEAAEAARDEAPIAATRAVAPLRDQAQIAAETAAFNALAGRHLGPGVLGISGALLSVGRRLIAKADRTIGFAVRDPTTGNLVPVADAFGRVGALEVAGSANAAVLTRASANAAAAISTLGRAGPGVRGVRGVVLSQARRPLQLTDGSGISVRADRILLGLSDVARRATDAASRVTRPGPGVRGRSAVSLSATRRVLREFSPRGQTLTRRPDGVLADPHQTALDAAAIAERAIQAARQVGPGVGDYAGALLTAGRRLLTGTSRAGQVRARGEVAGQIITLGAGGSGLQQALSYNVLYPPGLVMPDAGVDILVPLVGQSFADGYVDDFNASEGQAYNTAPITGAWMPAAGLRPGNVPFGAYVPLRAIPSGGQPNELSNIEAVITIQAAWAAAFPGAPQPRIITFAVTAGGNPIQRFARGGDIWATLVSIVQQCRAVSASQGRRLICPLEIYIQGQANRGGGWAMSSRSQFAQLLIRRQADDEALYRELLGQHERVPLITTAIQRNNQPAFVALAALDAALLAPDRVILANPEYAMEYANDGFHALGGGYRRSGYHVGRAAVEAVFGSNYRMLHMTQGWMQDATTFRAAVHVPRDADGLLRNLVLDTSGELVEAAGLGVSAGFAAYDRTGPIAVTGVSVSNSAAHPADATERAISVSLGTAPHAGSLRVPFACSSSGFGAALGGRYGPRGLIRIDDGVALPGLTPLTHTWMPPMEMRCADAL